MEVIFLPEAVEDLRYWRKSGNEAVQKKITQLVKAIRANPFEGIGKPEPLRHNLAGKWSRRINSEHRLVYSIEEDMIYVYSLRGHYK